MRTVLALLLLAVAACGGPDTTPVPDGITFRVEQSRQDLKTRNFGLQVANDGSKPITVSRVKLTSGRLDEPSTYRGPATVRAGGRINLIMVMSRARCGTGIDATATVTYRVGNGEPTTSVVRPKDHYGSVARFMRRDCAQASIDRVVIDPTFTVRGEGSDSVLQIGITFTPRSDGGPVHVGPLAGTTLLKPSPGSTIDVDLAPGGKPRRAVVDIIPNRCDVHVVAEDRTGAAMPLRIQSRAAGKAMFYLIFDEEQKTQIFDFIADHCGFGEVQDPLLAP